MTEFFKYACETPPTGAAAVFALQLQGQLPTLVTERLILRAPKVEDFETYQQIVCGPRGRYMADPKDPPMSREDAWADFCNTTANWVLHGHGMWTIGHAGDVAGFVMLGFEPGDREPELGFMLLPRFEGRSVAYEAAEAAKSYAFDTLGWRSLVSYVDPGNTRSARLATRLGARPDGTVQGSTVYRYEALQ